VLSERFGEHILISLMSQYTPQAKALAMADLNRPLTEDEIEDALDYLDTCDFLGGYVQTSESVGEGFIPPFEALEGVPGAKH